MFQQQPPHFAQARPVAPAGNQFARDLTGSDLSSHLGTVQGSGALYRAFFYSQVLVQNADEPQRWETRLCLATAVRGDRLTISHTFISEDIAAREFPQEWQQFKSDGLEGATHGTPLHELPGMSNSQLALLGLYRVRTIEELVGIGADNAAQIGIEASAAFTLARAWMEKSNAGAVHREAAERAAMAEAKEAAAEKRAAAQDAQIAALTAQLSILLQGAGAVGAAPAHAGPVAVEGEAFNVREGVDDPFDHGTDGTVTGNDDLSAAGPNDELLEELAPPVPAPSRGRKG